MNDDTTNQANTAPTKDMNTDKQMGSDLKPSSIPSNAKSTEKRPGSDYADVPTGRVDDIGRKLTPSTSDRAAVLAPDDTFPGSGPLHPDDY